MEFYLRPCPFCGSKPELKLYPTQMVYSEKEGKLVPSKKPFQYIMCSNPDCDVKPETTACTSLRAVANTWNGYEPVEARPEFYDTYPSEVVRVFVSIEFDKKVSVAEMKKMKLTSIKLESAIDAAVFRLENAAVLRLDNAEMTRMDCGLTVEFAGSVDLGYGDGADLVKWSPTKFADVASVTEYEVQTTGAEARKIISVAVEYSNGAVVYIPNTALFRTVSQTFIPGE